MCGSAAVTSRSRSPLHYPCWICLFIFFFLIIRRPRRATLFPSTTLFRSVALDDVASALPVRGGLRGQMLGGNRSEEHTSELQSHSFLSYPVFCLKKKT